MWFAQCFCRLHDATRSDQIAMRLTSVTVWVEHACVGVYTYEYCRLSLRRVTALSSLTGTWLLSPMLRFGLCNLAVFIYSSLALLNLSPTNLIWFCDNFLPAHPCPAFWFMWLLAQPSHCLYIRMETLCHPRLNDTKLFHLLHVFYSNNHEIWTHSSIINNQISKLKTGLQVLLAYLNEKESRR